MGMYFLGSLYVLAVEWMLNASLYKNRNRLIHLATDYGAACGSSQVLSVRSCLVTCLLIQHGLNTRDVSLNLPKQMSLT